MTAAPPPGPLARVALVFSAVALVALAVAVSGVILGGPFLLWHTLAD